MSLEDEFRLLVGGYYGVYQMDEYSLKVYILKEIENYIKEFVIEYPINKFNYQLEVDKIADSLPLKRKLQDALIVLNKIKAPIELVLLVKQRLITLEVDN